MQKELLFYVLWFSHSYSSKLQGNLKEKQKKGNNSAKNIFFKKPKKGILDRYKRNVMYQFQSLNGQDKPVRQYGRQTGITKNLATFWQKKLL